MTLKIGDKVPAFSIPIAEDQSISAADFEGKKLVIYFYPKDNTPGCTTEASDFNEHMDQFESLNTAIMGVSKDSLKKHQNFSNKLGLNFPLASDEKTQMCEAFDVWVEKSMYGKKYMGIERATFLIDEKGSIIHIWRKVKVPNHVQEIVDMIKKNA